MSLANATDSQFVMVPHRSSSFVNVDASHRSRTPLACRFCAGRSTGTKPAQTAQIHRRRRPRPRPRVNDRNPRKSGGFCL